jgi:hypothetical protein
MNSMPAVAIIIATLLSPRAARLAEAKAFTGPILLEKFNSGPGRRPGRTVSITTNAGDISATFASNVTALREKERTSDTN